MDDREYEERLHAAILRQLGISEPPYQLRVMMDVGSATVELRDASSGTNDFGQGRYVWATTLTDLHDAAILERARQAAEEIRPHLSAGDPPQQ